MAALLSYDILDTDDEPGFDRLVELVARICETPIGLVSLVDEHRIWFKAGTGLTAREVARDRSLCGFAVENGSGLIVPDTFADPRFAGSPLVTGEPNIRFYAGALLKTPEGEALGTLCVIDTEPRPEGLSETQQLALSILADQVMARLDLRKTARLAAENAERVRLKDADLAEISDAMAISEAKFRAIADSMPQMVWSAQPDGFHDYYNERWYVFTGVPEGPVDGEDWNDLVHAQDREQAWKIWRQSLATGDAYEVEYRLKHHSGLYRWTLGRAVPIRNAAGEITRWFGTYTDIDEMKRLEQISELLSQELSHRIKNIFAVVSALISLSARQHPDAKGFAKSIRTRINALALAHEFVRPHTESSRPSVGAMTLHAFLGDLFKPYADGDGRPRVVISGDDAAFDDQAATSVALLFHELATNATKYGALSNEGGGVRLNTRQRDDRYVLTWEEHDGPPVAGKPERSGFGSSLSSLSVEGQLGGRLERTWAPQGLCVVADLPATALSRRRAAMQTT